MDDVLSAVGPRLKATRTQRALTLAFVAAETGISVSTLSRLEAGQRKPTLELLLPLARVYGVPLDGLVGAPATGDPRIHPRPITKFGQTILPLSKGAGGLQAFKHMIQAGPLDREPELKTHPGHEWMYVIRGRLRLILGEHDLTLGPGEAAEFDTHTPHWVWRADTDAVEFLSLYGPQGEKMHVRASTRKG